MISIKNLHKVYQLGNNHLHVLKGIDLEVQEGELVSIMGSSGSGKSTLLNIIGILDAYEKGEYLLNGKLIRDLSENKAAYYRNHMIGFVFQTFNLINYKNAVENVALPLFYQGIGRKKRNALAMEYLDKVGLADWAEHLPNQLSGGQMQRVAIARAMVTKPNLILADEPTGALDTKTSYEIMDLFKEINDAGITVVIVTHEQDIAEMTKKIIRLKDGVIEETIIPQAV